MTDATMTDAALAKSFAQENEDPWLLFLTITHPLIEDGPLRLVRNSVDVGRTVGGNQVTFNRSSFELQPPAQGAESISVGRISVPNSDRDIVNGLRKLQGTDPATVFIEWSLASDPDTLQGAPIELDIESITHNLQTVEAQLTSGPINSAWPALVIDNASFPGVFPG